MTDEQFIELSTKLEKLKDSIKERKKVLYQNPHVFTEEKLDELKKDEQDCEDLSEYLHNAVAHTLK